MSRIDDLIAELCPDGVKFKALGEVGNFIRGNGLQKSQLVAEGTPAIHYGEVHTHYGVWTEETKSFVPIGLAAKLRRARSGDLIIATTSEDDAAVAKATAWIGGDEVAVSGDAYVYHHTLDPKYAAYFFQSTSFQDQKTRYVTGAKVRRISGESLAKILIPVPPLEIQREIVRVLDRFIQLEAELEAELEVRRKQYENYQNRLMFSDRYDDSCWTTLGDVCIQILSGGTPLKSRKEYYGGEIPWLRTQEVRYADIHDTEMTITASGLDNSSARWIPENSVIIAISGAGVTRGRVAVNKIPLTTNQHCCGLVMDPGKAVYRFVYHYLKAKYDELRSRGRGNRSDLTVGIIKAFKIPLPPLGEQRRIASVLDKFDALVNDLSSGLPAEIAARRKQYEYYRDRLLTFEEKR